MFLKFTIAAALVFLAGCTKTATTELQAIESRLAAIAENIDTLKENTRFYRASTVYNIETGGQPQRIQVKLLLGCPEPQLPPTIPRPPPSDNCAFTADAIGITVTGLAEQKLGNRAVLMEYISLDGIKTNLWDSQFGSIPRLSAADPDINLLIEPLGILMKPRGEVVLREPNPIGRLAASASIVVGLYVTNSIESATLRVNVVGEVPQGIKVIRPDAPVTQPGLRLIINEIP